MQTYADKNQENKSRSASAQARNSQQQNTSAFQFVDNRPEAIQMQKLQEMANDYTQKNSLQFVDNRPEAVAQRKLQEIANNSLQAKQVAQLQGIANNHSAQQQPIQKKKNNTGLPDNLKSGIENLSGYSMDDVKVHYNSEKPAQLQAHAYAQGTDIHIASGQEKHLPHEAWHVVQQKQERVKPTTQFNGAAINDNVGLEKEADVMGMIASKTHNISVIGSLKNMSTPQKYVLQPVWIKTGQGNVWVDNVDLTKFERTDEVQEADNEHPKDFVYRQKKVDKAKAKAERVKKALEKEEAGKEIPEKIKDKSEDVFKLSNDYLLKGGTKVYRMTDGLTARQYVLTGLPMSMNHKDGEEWLQLGPGLYTSKDPESVKHYASKLGSIDSKLKQFEIRGLPVMLEIELLSDAKGIMLNDPEKAGVDSAKYLEMKSLIESTDFIHHEDESDPPQTKFHPRFIGNLKIVNCHVKEGKNYKTYDPETFVKDFEKYLVSKHKEAAKKQFHHVIEEQENQFEPSPGFDSAKDAEIWQREAIKYAELASQYERNLGVYCAGASIAKSAVESLVMAVWNIFSAETNDLLKLGAKRPGVTGGVWSELQLLKQVVESGNLREQLSILYNGYSNRLFEKLNDNKPIKRPDFFKKEREDRRSTGIKDKKTDQNPFRAVPELSHAEWLTSVNKDGRLTWEPGEKVYEFQMQSNFQRMAENTGALVMTGTSGTAYGILQSAELIGKRAQIKPDFLGLRIALLGWMLPARDHTYHEIMTACALFDPNLEYQDGYKRYRSLLPFNESELRKIGPNGQFPDEVINALKEFNPKKAEE